MQLNAEKIGRIYTTLSLAVLPVVLVAMFTYIYTFDATGPQAQALPTLMLVFAVILTVLGVNTLAATLLSVFVSDVRPKLKQYFYTLLAMVVLAGLLYEIIILV